MLLMLNVEVRGAPPTKVKRSRRTLIIKLYFKIASGRRVPLTDLLAGIFVKPNDLLKIMRFLIQ